MKKQNIVFVKYKIKNKNQKNKILKNLKNNIFAKKLKSEKGEKICEKLFFVFLENRQLFHLSKKKIIMEIRVICIFDFGVIDVFLSNVLPLKKHLLFGGCEHRICVQRWNTKFYFLRVAKNLQF